MGCDDQKKSLPFRQIGTVLLALVMFSVQGGCGYQFKGGLKAPAGVHTISVRMLENRTLESGIEVVFTNDFLYEFTRSKVLQVAGPDGADAVLSGTIVSLNVDTISHTADYDSSERRVTITLDLALTGANGEVLWSDRALSDREEYQVSLDKLTTEGNRRRAIEALSERLAEKVHNRVLQDF
ncbi:MAG: LPS assembly lipoprotein LptE [Thermodesulfobacteriota bacterium]|nr:LPS assembly lipoprotein LptE [Thermodesulfobacteriota bacterium]